MWQSCDDSAILMCGLLVLSNKNIWKKKTLSGVPLGNVYRGSIHSSKTLPVYLLISLHYCLHLFICLCLPWFCLQLWNISYFLFCISKSGPNFLFCFASLSLCLPPKHSPLHGYSLSGSVGYPVTSKSTGSAEFPTSLMSLCGWVWPAEGVARPEQDPFVPAMALKREGFSSYYCGSSPCSSAVHCGPG